MKTAQLRQQLQCTEIAMRCIAIGVTICVQSIGLTVMIGHYSLELQRAWAELRRKLDELFRQLRPQTVKRTGRMWDDIEEALRLGGLL